MPLGWAWVTSRVNTGQQAVGAKIGENWKIGGISGDAAPQAPPARKLKQMQRRRRCQEQKDTHSPCSAPLCSVLSDRVGPVLAWPGANFRIRAAHAAHAGWGRGTTPPPLGPDFRGCRGHGRGSIQISEKSYTSLVAGTPVAGTLVAGTLVAGTLVAGTLVAGDL
eukprot:gene11823-biopygen9450